MLAHSARPELGIPAQSYWEHVSAVVAEASSNVRDASEFWRGDRQFIEVVVEYAALVHDLGKLDTDNQKVLGSTSKGGLPWAHEDAGIKHLLDQRQIEAALLVASHHAGLPNEPAERNKKNDYCRSDKPGVRERTNSLLPEYLREQQTACLKTVQVRPPGLKGMDWSNLAHRIALSCLVDADHGDTARNYRNESDTAPPPTNWVRRIDALDRYVAGLPRDESRSRACRSAPTRLQGLP